MRVKLIINCVVALALLTSCSPTDSAAGFDARDSHDRYKHLTREDFRELNEPPKPASAQAEVAMQPPGAPIPDIAQMLAAPHPPKISQGKLVSISVTDDVPLRDVLFELSRLADVDIELGNGITGGINFRAKNKPFNDVIERIADLSGLRYEMRNGVLRVERDTPYIKNYSLDFLNVVRSSSSSTALSTDVLSASVSSGSSSGSSGGSSSSGSSGSSGGSSNSGLKTGTNASITATAESDLWSALDASVAEILSYHPPGWVDDTDVAATSARPGGAISNGYVINRQAGVLSVNATQRQHEVIQKFLSLMERNASAQVLIEAKVVEITLNDNFRSGVNWDGVLGKVKAKFNYQPTTAISGTNGVTFAINQSGASLDDVISLTQDFGTSRTLSSPRLHAMNNQQAVLTFAENRIYFTCNQNTGSATTTGSGSTTTTGAAFQCQQGSIPIGILMSILPTVNLDTNEVTLNVRPTLSRQVGTVADPGTAISLAASVQNATGAAATALAAVDNEIPVVEVRELDSVMKVKNGGIMVIGGLLEEVNKSTEGGMPGLSELPWVGNAFKSRDDSNAKRELIIFIKASIVGSDGNYAPADKHIYQKFTTDSRPLNF